MNWLNRLDDIANDLLPEEKEEEEEETKTDKKPNKGAGEEKQQRAEENKNVLDESGLHPVSHEGSIESSRQVQPLEPLETNATTPARDRQQPDEGNLHHHHHHHPTPFSSVWLRVDDNDDSGGILNDPLLPSMNINETATPVRSSSSSKDSAPQTPHERLQRGLERVMQRVVETAASSTSKLHALDTHNNNNNNNNNNKEDGSDQQQQLPWVVDSVDDVILMGGSHPLPQQQQVELSSENAQQPQQEAALSVSSTTTNIFTQQPTGDDTSERPDSQQSSPRRQNYPATPTANRFRVGESHQSALPTEIADTELRSMLHTSPSALSEPLPLSVAEQDDDDDGSVQTDDAGLAVDKRSTKNDPPVIDVSMPPSSVGLVTPSRQAQMRERFRQLQKDSSTTEQQQQQQPPEWNPEKGSFFDPTWNRYGVVQVRVLAAQRLPCPLGSSVQVALSLLPWKGKVRTLSSTCFRGPNDDNNSSNNNNSSSSDNGVCALWNNGGTTGWDDEETDNDDDDEPGCFMVHSYNNEETPIPTIRLDVVFLPLQMLEFVMASVELTAEPLLRHPGQWKRQWCQATLVQDNANTKEAGSGNHVPAVLLEAAFFPETDESVDGASTASEAVDKQDLVEDFDDGGNQDAPLPEKNNGAGSVSALSVRSPARDPSRSAAASPSVKTSRTFLLRAKKRTHFMQVQSLWVPPARCMLCGKSVVGWKLAHRCEHCGVTCCTDCLIQIDLQLPCGTATTKEVVERDEQSRWTLERVLATVAPDESYQKKKKKKHEGKKQKLVAVVDKQRPRRIGALETSLQPSHDSNSSGVGKLLVSIDSAYLFADQLPMETELDTVFTESVRHPQRVADHYVRVTAHGSVESKRTHTIQNTATPRFESDVWVFEVPHYGMEYRVDVIDAKTERSIGSTMLTAQGLLEWQREVHIRDAGLAAFTPGMRRAPSSSFRSMQVELRSGLKAGFGIHYFRDSKPAKGERPGSISGWIKMRARLEEHTEKLFGQEPVECGPRPSEDFDIEIIQSHIARITALFGGFTRMVRLYSYVVSWEDPVLTFSSLCVFVWTCLRFNTEYVGSLPVFVVVVYMLFTATIRKSGKAKEMYMKTISAAKTQKEDLSDTALPLHRPCGQLYIRPQKVRNLQLPGSIACRVFWDPLRFVVGERARKDEMESDALLQAQHDIGETSFVSTVNPVWDSVSPSNECQQIQKVLSAAQPTEHKSELFGPAIAGNTFLSFPLLQPVTKTATKRKDSKVACLLPWGAMKGAIVIQVRFRDQLNRIPGLEEVVSEVIVPLSDTVKHRSTERWFDLTTAGSQEASGSHHVPGRKSPRMLVDLQWDEPEFTDNGTGTPHAAREKSILVEEELSRWASRTRPRLDLLGSSVGAYNSVVRLRDTLQSMQNTLGGSLDSIESLSNAFSFMEPHFSSLILLLVSSLWIILAVFPTRYIILIGGLAQYVATFSLRFLSSEDSSSSRSVAKSQQDTAVKVPSGSSAYAVWFQNAMRSLPTSADLKRLHHWELSALVQRERSKQATQRRGAKLKELWRASWFSCVHVPTEPNKSLFSLGLSESSNPRSDSKWIWESKFAVVHGRRLLLWSSQTSFDDADPPELRIFLSGHAGLGGLSPLDLRKFSPEDDVSRVISIFGRGSSGQQKLILRVPSVDKKNEFEQTILNLERKED